LHAICPVGNEQLIRLHLTAMPKASEWAIVGARRAKRNPEKTEKGPGEYFANAIIAAVGDIDITCAINSDAAWMIEWALPKRLIIGR